LTQRQRAIIENEQLAIAAASSSSKMPPKGPQTQEPDSSAVMDQTKKSSIFVTEKRMVAPGSRDAPKFKSTRPEELRRFIRLMEDLWTDCGVTSDETKKMMIGKYADQDSEEEWQAFETFDGLHSWEEFKDELLENYPEAAAAERGTPARIRQICSEAIKAGKLMLGDMVSFYAFRRSFVSEGKKLRKAPAVMANRELVELFIGCLSDTFASAVLQYLGNKTPEPKATIGSKVGLSSNDDDDSKPRRPEDRYNWEEVCKAALQVSENSQGMYNLVKKTEQRGVMLFSQPVSETKALNEKLNELEGEQALDKDRLVSLGKTLESRMGGIEDLIKSLMKNGKEAEGQNVCRGDCKNSNCKMHDTTSNSVPQKWAGKSLDNEKCFWCGFLGHFQADCEDLKNQIRLGNVKMNHEGKLRLKDGSFLPRNPVEASLKERVERHYAKKPSQYFYGEYDDNDPMPSAATSVFSQLLGTSNDADKRTIVQLKAELDLRKREEALELKQRMLEKSDKMTEQTGGSNRTANVLELLGQLSDDELAAIKAAKSSFA
jgi:hypothetical protein